MAAPDKLEEWEPSAAMRACREDVARAFGVPSHRLVGRARARTVILPRQAACYVLRARFPELSWPKIGRLLGGRDHSTVIYGAREAASRMRRDPEYARVLDELCRGRAASFDPLVRVGAPKPAPLPKPPVESAALRPVNSLEDDDRDARSRRAGTLGLAAALAREGMVCR